MISFPGPPELGRGVVIGPDQALPIAFSDAETLEITAATLQDPTDVLRRLHNAFASRTPVVVRLLVDHRDLLEPQTDPRPPWLLGPRFEFERERLHFLVWANNYDLRDGEFVWWHAHKAKRLGATIGGPADVELADGRAAWVDGGPRGPVAVDLPVVHRESIELGALHTSPANPKAPSGRLAGDQMAAVSHVSGPARIIAPAGSGKTRTLTARLEHLRRDRWIEPELVTAVAYNTRAKDEMTRRLGDLPATVRTIHSLAYAIVRQKRPRAQVITEGDQRRLLAPLITQTPAVNKDITAPYLEALRQVRVGLERPEIVAEARDDVPGFVDLFERYREILQQRDLLDFDEQISNAISILATDPAVRRRVQGSARHLLVDEFQDLAPAFLLLLRLVAAPAYNVFGVGDDDQVIYGYAGATPDFLIDFADLFPGAHAYALDANYRCPSDVTTSAATLLGYNKRRIDKSITASSGRPGGLEVIQLPPTALAAAAADKIDQWRVGRSLTDIAVLSRVNHALLPIQLELTVRGVPHNAPVGEEFLDRSAVKALLAYIRIGLAPDLIAVDDLLAVLNRPARRLSKIGRDIFKRQRRWTIIRLRAEANALTGSANERFHIFVDDLESVATAVTDQSTASVVAMIRSTIGLDNAATLLDSSRSTADRSGHTDDLDALEQIAELFPSPNRFEIELRDLLSRPGHSSAVTLSTIHKVKGMEWPHVIVMPVSTRTMPHHRATDIEEERRIFHVAITRASEYALVMSDAEQPSRFIGEMAGTAVPDPLPSEPRTGGVLAGVGQKVSWNGQQGEVAAVGKTGVTVLLPTGFRLDVPWREMVTVDGARGLLAAPLPADRDPDPHLFEALRSWRKERASEDNVPAYIVLSDKHLRAIAATRPTTLEELLSCPGIGPTKLDRYGEEILEAIETVDA